MTRIPHLAVLRTILWLTGAGVLIAIPLAPARGADAAPPEPMDNSPAAAQVQALVKEFQDRLKQGYEAGRAQWEAKNDIEKAEEILKIEQPPSSKVGRPTEEEAKEIIAAAKADKMRLKWGFVERIITWGYFYLPDILEQEFSQKLADLGETAIPAILKTAHMNEASGTPGSEANKFSGIVCQLMIEALAKSPQGEDGLIEMTHSETEWVRLSSLLGLFRRSDEKVVHRAIEMFQSPNIKDKVVACRFFEHLPDGYEADPQKRQEILGALLAANDDPDGGFRAEAVAQLWRYGGQAELPFLKKLSTSDEYLFKKSDTDKGLYLVRRSASAAIVGILARSPDTPEREEGIKLIPPAPLFSLHLMRQMNEELPGREWLHVDSQGVVVDTSVDPLPIITEKSIASVEASFDEYNNFWRIGVNLTRPGALCLARYSLSHLHHWLAILVDGVKVGDMTLWEPELWGEIQIDQLTKDQADEIAAKLNAAIQARTTQSEPAPAAP